MKQIRTYRLIELFLLYLGCFCFVISNLPYRYIDKATLNLLNNIGVVAFICGTIFLASDKINRKIDKLSSNNSALNELGISQIVPYKGKGLEKLFAGNREIKIIINANRLDSIGVIFDATNELSNTTFSILVLGRIPVKKSLTLDRYLRFYNCKIKTTEKSGIDSIAILDQTVCELNYTGYGSDIEYICVFYGSSGYGLKSKSLFEELWYDSKTKQYEKGENS